MTYDSEHLQALLRIVHQTHGDISHVKTAIDEVSQTFCEDPLFVASLIASYVSLIDRKKQLKTASFTTTALWRNFYQKMRIAPYEEHVKVSFDQDGVFPATPSEFYLMLADLDAAKNRKNLSFICNECKVSFPLGFDAECNINLPIWCYRICFFCSEKTVQKETHSFYQS